MMIERIRPWVRGKKVLILGFGREGKSTWNVLKKLDCCSFVDVADMAQPKEKPEGGFGDPMGMNNSAEEESSDFVLTTEAGSFTNVTYAESATESTETTAA